MSLRNETGLDVLYYNSSGNNYKGNIVPRILNAIALTGLVARNLNPTGIVDDALIQDIDNYNQSIGNTTTIEDDTNILPDEYNNNFTNNPHYDPYFLNTSDKPSRKNHKDIKIVLGDNANIKTIHDVFMRSVSVQVDTSGNPISEVYSFIARDITESDAIEDQNKYIGESENVNASSDIKYEINGVWIEG